MRRPAAHPGISLGPYENHWKTYGFRVSAQVEHGVPSRAPCFSPGNLTVIGNPSKSFRKHTSLASWKTDAGAMDNEASWGALRTTQKPL